MRTEEIKIYTFDELDESAKEKAREWWRNLENQDFDPDFAYDDFVAVAKILGIEFRTQAVKLYGGGTRNKPCIYWTGFYSQGDGACFDADYSYAKGAAKAIRVYAPKDEMLHRIADDLQAVQKRHFYKLTASTKHSGHYYHSGCMTVDVEHSDDSYRDIDADDIIQAMRDFADWMYRQLEAEYEYTMSDENVDRSIRCNEYEFEEDGTRF